ncbi:uveal autoantigen with coiled-coil domains and ankyrin repeats isoform A [Patagioenas fasciata monilis]|uniref:Uveal autoantigen with coiled-coil domains and ankyrin repeats isoform A n=1 Tax=Patagioenas fasciata monilis TaxID=372326 RepID=A0A1V4JDM4_PATFA|nr:uveal autoantigen with coiled-coil domains and ankyrin repeats isoform A [Patagioenas fasciata monilis]
MTCWFSCAAKDTLNTDWNKYDDRLMKAAERGDVEKVQSILAKKGVSPSKLDVEGRSAFHVVASKGNLDCLNTILVHGVDITATDAAGRNALHLAAKYGHALCLQKLLQYNCPTENVDLQGRTALHDAAMSDCSSSIQLLCDHGASVNSKDGDGRTPLVLATQMCRPMVCQLLIDRGADVNARDKQNRTALMLGCEYGCKDAVEVLLRNGADVSLTDALGHDCAYYARIGDNIDILALIKAAVEDSSKARDAVKKGQPEQKITNMSQKWNRLHAQEEVNVKLYQKDHDAQELELENQDLKDRMREVQEEQRMLLDRISGLQLQLSEKDELKKILTTKEKQQEENLRTIEALKAKLKYYEVDLAGPGSNFGNRKEDLLLMQGQVFAVESQSRSMLRPLELSLPNQSGSSEKETLKKELDNVRTCYGAAKEEISKLQRELSHKVAECKALASECERTKAESDGQIKQLEDALKDVQKRMFESEGKVKQMQTHFLALKDHLTTEAASGSSKLAEELKEQLKEMKTKYEGASAEVGKLRNQIKQNELLVAEFKRDEGRLVEENKSLQKELVKLEMERDERGRNVMELEGQLKEMAAKLAQSVTSEKFENMKSLLSNEVNEKARKLAEMEREHEKLQAEIGLLKRESESQKAKLAQHVKPEDHEQMRSGFEQKHEQLGKTISELSQKNQTLQKELERLQMDNKTLKQQIQMLKSEIKSQNVPLKIHEELKKTNDLTVGDLTKKLFEITKKYNESKAEAEKLLAEKNNLSENISHFQAVYLSPEQHKKEVEALKSNGVELEKQLAELQKKYDDGQAKVSKLMSENTAIRESLRDQELSDLKGKTEEIKQAFMRLHVEIEAQKKELDTIQECIKSKYAPVASFEDREQSLEATVKELRAQLQEQQNYILAEKSREMEKMFASRMEELNKQLRELLQKYTGQKGEEDESTKQPLILQPQPLSAGQIEAAKQALGHTVEDLKEALRKYTQMKEMLEQEIVATKNSLKEKEEENRVKNEKILELQSKVEFTQQALRDLESRDVIDMSEYKSMKSALEAQISSIAEKFSNMNKSIEQEIKDQKERCDKSLTTIIDLQKRIQESAKQVEAKDNKITELLNDVERLKQALNGLSQLTYTTGVPSKRQSQQVEMLQSQVRTLQQQLADAKRQHQEVVSVYRTHLLSAVQGHMDEDVQAALLQIIRMRQGLVC